MPDLRRIDRVNMLIQRELSEIIQRQVKDPRVGFCSVSQVEASVDLRYADVKVSVIGDRKRKRNAVAGLKSAAGFLRREVGRRIGLRHAPELRFELDDSVDHLLKIDNLLKQVRDEENRLGLSSESAPESDEEATALDLRLKIDG